MTTSAQVGVAQRRRIEGYPASNYKFDLIVAILCFYLLCGLCLDGWAHNSGEVDNTFFTPWHAVLYSGYGAVGLVLVTTQLSNVMKGYAWTRALPRGYGLALIGVVMFGAGGGFDLLWHSLFGFEVSVEALLSPAHLVLATGGFLFIGAPLRSAWMRSNSAGWANLLPAMISLISIFMVMTFFTQYSHYLSDPWAVSVYESENYVDVYNIYHFVTPAALMMGVLLVAMRRWTLPIGFLTVMMIVQTGLMFWVRYAFTQDYKWLLIAPIAAGIIGDILLVWLKPSPERTLAWRSFAFLFPFILCLAYFGILIVEYGTWWAIHMWLGVTFLSGFVGLFLSYLAVPPALRIEEEK